MDCGTFAHSLFLFVDGDQKVFWKNAPLYVTKTMFLFNADKIHEKRFIHNILFVYFVPSCHS